MQVRRLGSGEVRRNLKHLEKIICNFHKIKNEKSSHVLVIKKYFNENWELFLFLFGGVYSMRSQGMEQRLREITIPDP